MDIAGLSKATSETIILLLSVLSFMTFGYGTEVRLVVLTVSSLEGASS
jgi:uncharacterized membrane protein YgaE (UPF0421/DUF939 family)